MDWFSADSHLAITRRLKNGLGLQHPQLSQLSQGEINDSDQVCRVKLAAH
jgi:hypothetical protein